MRINIIFYIFASADKNHVDLFETAHTCYEAGPIYCSAPSRFMTTADSATSYRCIIRVRIDAPLRPIMRLEILHNSFLK
ncbi:hypothetical protein SAMN05216175_107114 [Neptunomonas qingdaonensis]|uniref:Uncharacterized protein n=1 Tax=Neptunomonas qingdaonensis TaxID=1045558 RepID=A0A1I2S4X6_9GAMM|nr:hypothetical protein SAMN05216175_107114 [Neptunomonas qingdaonensis]